jgi:hypothetical protein
MIYPIKKLITSTAWGQASYATSLRKSIRDTAERTMQMAGTRAERQKKKSESNRPFALVYVPLSTCQMVNNRRRAVREMETRMVSRSTQEYRNKDHESHAIPRLVDLLLVAIAH